MNVGDEGAKFESLESGTGQPPRLSNSRPQWLVCATCIHKDKTKDIIKAQSRRVYDYGNTLKSRHSV